MFVHMSYYFLGRDFLEENDSGQKMYISVSLCLGMCAKSLKLLLTLCDPVDCSPPGSSVHGILQAGITYCGIFLYAHQQIAFPDGPIISMMTILPNSQYLQISINILKFLPCVFLSLSLFDYFQG